MSTDRLLGTLLRSLQTYTEHQDTPRLLSTAASLLTSLTNPLNITLLTSQLLTARAIWDRPDGLQTCLRFMGLFHSAAITVLNHHYEVRDGHTPALFPGQVPIGGGLALHEWVTAVIKGADDRSVRWKHLMVISGLLLGFNQQEDESLSGPTKLKLERALVHATNMALVEARGEKELGAQCVALVLNHSFPVLSDIERSQLDYDRLLQVLVGTVLFSSEGLQSTYFIGSIDFDVKRVNGNQYIWPPESSSFHQVERILSRPLVSSMGPLSRLIAHTVESVDDHLLIVSMMEDLTAFARALTTHWRQNKLSEVDQSEETRLLHPVTVGTTFPLLWKVLKSALFAVIIVLRGVMARVLGDGKLAADGVAPLLASQTLHILRNLYFISSRTGGTSLSQYTFVYLAAIDILNQYPALAESFVEDIRPTELGQIPTHPLERCMDLYFLNTAEHFTLILPPRVNENLLIGAAVPYLTAGGDRSLISIFEAAHSTMLAVFSASHSSPIATKHLPFYIDALFGLFPQNLSPRQFRLAFKTLMRVTAPPSSLSATHPDLPATLLEMLHYRAVHAPSVPLQGEPIKGNSESDPVPPLSEQGVLIFTLLDVLPFLPITLLDEWLPLAAQLIQSIPDRAMQDACRRRFWEIIISGEMDPERSQSCVAWWNSRHGREMVLHGYKQPKELYFMSGALPAEAREHKL